MSKWLGLGKTWKNGPHRSEIWRTSNSIQKLSRTATTTNRHRPRTVPERSPNGHLTVTSGCRPSSCHASRCAEKISCREASSLMEFFTLSVNSWSSWWMQNQRAQWVPSKNVTTLVGVYKICLAGFSILLYPRETASENKGHKTFLRTLCLNETQRWLCAIRMFKSRKPCYRAPFASPCAWS